MGRERVVDVYLLKNRRVTDVCVTVSLLDGTTRTRSNVSEASVARLSMLARRYQLRVLPWVRGLGWWFLWPGTGR